MNIPPVALDINRLQSQFSVSPFLHRLLRLQNVASACLEALTDDQVDQLRVYYNYGMVRRRRVLTDVPSNVWNFDLACSLAATLFAREHVQARQCSTATLKSMVESLLACLCQDLSEPWFRFAVRQKRYPTMIAMPSLPAINLGNDEERFYVQSITDTWPSKTVSHLEGDVLKISSEASRHFVDDVIVGDLGDVELTLTPHEKSFVQNHSIGWISRYQTTTRTVTIIEIDPRTDGKLLINEDGRRAAYNLVHVEEQRLDMYGLDMKMHEDDAFVDNFVLSRLLTVDQTLSAIPMTTQDIDVKLYIHVNGSSQIGLGAVDEEVFLKSLGSISAKNKLRSAISIAAKARLTQLRNQSGVIRNVVPSDVRIARSRMVSCGVDGIYIQTRIPFDSVLVVIVVAAIALRTAQILISLEGVRSFGEILVIAVLTTVGVSLTYHNLRYKGWVMHETIRLRRNCVSDEDMYDHMSEEEVIRTVAAAGAKGTRMDGIQTSPFSDSRDGTFSVRRQLRLDMASRAGLKLRLRTTLKPVWVDLRGVREVQKRDNTTWHVCGPYIDVAYLELTAMGPSMFGE